MTRRLQVYDTDGVNPYGREVARLLADMGCTPVLVMPVDAEWVPPVTTHAVLPANRGGQQRLGKALSLLRTLLLCAAMALRHPRAPWLVVWTASAADELLFAAMARLRVPVVLVVHNPGPRQLHRRSARILRRAATRLVVHSDELAAALEQEGLAGTVVIAPHPPYLGWWHAFQAEREVSPQLRLLFAGQLQEHKGLHRLPEIFLRMSPQARARTVLTVCGKGSLPAPLMEELRRWVPVVDETSLSFVTDRRLAAVLSRNDVLVAPYEKVTQSGSIALALTAGLAVTAFDGGALGELVADTGLVPAGDLAALAARLTAFALHGVPNTLAYEDVKAWDITARAGWKVALEGLARG